MTEKDFPGADIQTKTHNTHTYPASDIIITSGVRNRDQRSMYISPYD